MKSHTNNSNHDRGSNSNSVPQWRSVPLATTTASSPGLSAAASLPRPKPLGFVTSGGKSSSISRPTSIAGASSSSRVRSRDSSINSNDDHGIIRKEMYFNKDANAKEASPSLQKKSSNWSPKNLQPVPSFYPLEQYTSRWIPNSSSLEHVAYRISEINRMLSIHAQYDNEDKHESGTAAATLITAEHVEMHLSLWLSSSKEGGVIVEIQRRSGNSMAFHKYARLILNAADGSLDVSTMMEQDVAAASEVAQQQYTKMPSISASNASLLDDSIRAVEIAHGLIRKDRIDAQLLGLESLQSLTDSVTSDPFTALLASHVVLFGTIPDHMLVLPQEQEHAAAAAAVEAATNISKEVIVRDDTPYQEVHETIWDLIVEKDLEGKDDEDSDDDDSVCGGTASHRNLAFKTFANALANIEKSNSNRNQVATSEDDVARRILFQSGEHESASSSLLKSLIGEVLKSSSNPHDASLAANCVGSLLRMSSNSSSEKWLQNELMAQQDAKTVFSEASYVGQQTHRNLQTECETVMDLLEDAATTER